MLLSRFDGGHGGPLRIFASSKLSIYGSVYRDDPFNHPMLPYIWLGGKDAVGQNISAKLVSGDEEYPPTGDWGSPPMSNGFLVAVN